MSHHSDEHNPELRAEYRESLDERPYSEWLEGEVMRLRASERRGARGRLRAFRAAMGAQPKRPIQGERRLSMYVIKHSNGTYYAGPSGIGPRFGATLETAEKFRAKREALEEMGWHWAFADAEVVRVPKEECRAEGGE